MSSVAEIEAAIEKLPAPQVDELAASLEELRVRRATPPTAESWLERARRAGVNADQVRVLSRSEECLPN
jgi:hypothetical protein